MCIVLMHLHHPDFAFIVASNRDEFLARPTAPSHWHAFPSPSDFTCLSSSTPSLAQSKDGQVTAKGALEGTPASQPSAEHPFLSGIDVHPAGGGTWIGISRTGRFAALTNFTEHSPPPLPQDRGLTAYRSRGSLPRDWFLREDRDIDAVEDLDQYLDGVASRMDEWPGFNLLAGQLVSGRDGMDGPRIGYVSNRKEGGGVSYLGTDNGKANGSVVLACTVPGHDIAEVSSQRGCDSIGLSNTVLQKPWSKVLQGQKMLDEAVRKYDERKTVGSAKVDEHEQEEKLASDLFDILATAPGEDVPLSDLPSSILVRPVRRSMNHGWYATRTSTVLLVRRRPGQSGDGFPIAWWERDIHIVNQDGEVERCDTTNQRHYRTEIVAPKPKT